MGEISGIKDGVECVLSISFARYKIALELLSLRYRAAILENERVRQSNYINVSFCMSIFREISFRKFLTTIHSIHVFSVFQAVLEEVVCSVTYDCLFPGSGRTFVFQYNITYCKIYRCALPFSETSITTSCIFD